MIGFKARSTLVPVETYMRGFMPYGTPCDEPCEPKPDRLEALEEELDALRAELAALRAERGEHRRSGTGD